MNEELFQGLWAQAVGIDCPISRNVVRGRVKADDVWNCLARGRSVGFLLPLTSAREEEPLASMSLETQGELMDVALYPLIFALNNPWTVYSGTVFL